MATLDFFSSVPGDCNIEPRTRREVCALRGADSSEEELSQFIFWVPDDVASRGRFSPRGVDDASAVVRAVETPSVSGAPLETAAAAAAAAAGMGALSCVGGIGELEASDMCVVTLDLLTSDP